ncbi:histidine synthase subunit 1 [Seminavis robusta]|uniref:2-(3-amino-3-carboxypropyl)histidine synthase subunit 1 n=1 Tax=Seminavis robusta TaxID=568900 RepID=A0A9N8EVZ3_9STRA|nr:histidine synthase subunit 1 [Seminavis robusta]|eukprot:Sro2184_g318090.1 histidine synthase subunit 1 (419) ;mRNA; r:8009-9265
MTEHKEEEEPTTTSTTKKPRRVVRRKRKPAETPVTVDPVLLQKVLTESGLPKAYSFELEKSVQRIHATKASHVALQMPEGLLLYATVLADALKRLAAPVLQDVSILGDVTYGACCVGDLDAQALGAQLLIHYGHSCLVPIQHTAIPCLYVFVEIQLDVPHLVECLHTTLQQREQPETNVHVYVLGTVQFRHALVEATRLLTDEKQYQHVSIPQAKPLSPGEVLGCTSPKLHQHSTPQAVVCFVADGRFHLESTLISNPHIDTFYRYDPYGKTLTEESYNHDAMKQIRQEAIAKTKQSANTFGIILGTLGRQGNPAIVRQIQQSLRQHKKRSFLMLLSEITPAKLKLFGNKIDAWVQVACPRLSVDWGHYLAAKPVLTPYELSVCLEETKWQDVYPMDYYSLEGGPWSNYHVENKQRQL